MIGAKNWPVSDKKISIPQKCPKCGSKLWHTNAVDACGIYMVGCVNRKCRWCEMYVLRQLPPHLEEVQTEN